MSKTKQATKKPAKTGAAKKTKKSSAAPKKTISPKAAAKAPAKKAAVKPKLSRNEKSFNQLVDVWFDSTIEEFEEGHIPFEEIFHRLRTIFQVTCEDFDVSVHDAENIAWDFWHGYAEMRGENDDYVCPDCQAEQEA